jgi:hypothetical protein
MILHRKAIDKIDKLKKDHYKKQGRKNLHDRTRGSFQNSMKADWSSRANIKLFQRALQTPGPSGLAARCAECSAHRWIHHASGGNSSIYGF